MAAVDVLGHCCTTITNSEFYPVSSVILSITQGLITTVTTFTNHNLVTGTIVRLTISPNCGMYQINQLFGPITVTGNTTFTLPINSLLFDPFIVPENPNNIGFPPAQQQPCSFVVPIGELTLQLNAAVQNTLP